MVNKITERLEARKELLKEVFQVIVDGSECTNLYNLALEMTGEVLFLQHLQDWFYDFETSVTILEVSPDNDMVSVDDLKKWFGIFKSYTAEVLKEKE